MKKYDSYKDSGVEWIGEIPSGWRKSPIKYYYNYKKGSRGQELTKTYIQDNLGEYPVYSGQTENEGVLGRISEYEFDFPEGVIFTTTVGVKMMSTKVLRDKFSLSQNCLIMIPKKDGNSDFVNYFISVDWVFRKLQFPKILQPSLRMEDIDQYFFYCPTISEQQQIVSFLDTKTSLIDSLIEKTQQKIELLKEKRTSLINEVVTKGLNSNVEMKDSGEEWIGEIPIHWETGKLKNNSDLKISSIDKHIFEEEIQVIVCNYTDVYYNEFITSELPLRKGSCSENEYSNFILKRGDVIITKDSESPTDIGVPSLVKENLDNVVCGYHLSIIKSNPKKLVGGYLFRQLQTNRIRSYFEINSNGITRFGLGKSSVLETPLILPPNSEQQQIVEYLDEQTQLIDKTISIEEKRIELLKEYRQSLISEVVTGKRKVV